MENLYAVRDAFFWWAGVWATVTLGNRAISKALSRRRREEHAQWKREFMAFLFSADARPEGAETGEPKEAEAATETEESAEQPEMTNGDGAT